VSGQVVGNLEEPLCVLSPVSRHLTTICSSALSLWHPALAGLSPKERFSLLDASLYLGSSAPLPEELSRCVFLTNVSEAFNGVKGFVVAQPEAGSIQLLLQPGQNSPLQCSEVSLSTFCAAASAFALWVSEQEHAVLNRHA
jgi:hypothetical protein